MTSAGNSQPPVHIAGTAISPSTHWIIDTGASNHICSSLSLFTEYSACTSLSFVQLPDGSRAGVTHTGLFLTQPINFHLQNVFYIPSFKYNFLSVSQLTKSLRCLVSFYDSHCIFQDRTTKRAIGLGKVHDGLYFLKPSHALLVASSPLFDLWHWRLGHPSHSRSVDLSKEFLFITVSNKCKCTVCPIAKQSRLPFPSSLNKTSAPLELIHCDIWGRFTLPSLCGAHYFLTIVDDYTRCT